MTAKQKKLTHDAYTVSGNKVEKSEVQSDSELVQILIPKDMPYVKVRKALEIALLRVR